MTTVTSGKAFDTVIRGGRVVLETEERDLDIGIRDGKIAALASPGSLPDIDREISAAGRFVIPGGIDTHTHINWPLANGTSLDDFPSASEAAAISGTTTLLDFVPPPRSATHLEAGMARLAQAENRCATDFSFHPIIVDASEQTMLDIAELARLGMSSFKIFTTYDDMRLTDGEIFDVMKTIHAAGGLAGFHAENDEIIAHSVDKLAAAGRTTVSEFPNSRPELAEVAAIDLISLYARKLDQPIFIFHVSGGDGVEAILQARNIGTQVRAETCTHYLVFNRSAYEQEDGWMYVITPPLREEADREVLWSALKEGTLDCVGSDHCAYGAVHKKPDSNDFKAMDAGAPGIDARMPVVWSHGVSAGRLSPVEYARVTALGPAQTFGLYPRKGAIRVGADADLVIIDAERQWTWPIFERREGSDFQPYGGITGTGFPELTMLRGKVIAENGEFCGEEHIGQVLAQNIDSASWNK